MKSGAAHAWDAVGAPAASRADILAELSERISSMQRRTLGTGAKAPVVPVRSELSSLFPGQGLQPGGAYALASPLLAMMLLSAASQRGDWTAVIGLPDLSAEAVAAAGIDVERLAVIPHPGDQGVRVAATLAEVMAVVVLAGAHPSGGEVERLEARLRRAGSVLLVLGEWPAAVARLFVAEREWYGLEQGHGVLSSCRVTAVSEMPGRPRRRVQFTVSSMSVASGLIEHTDE